jgi:hypothetical protein
LVGQVERADDVTRRQSVIAGLGDDIVKKLLAGAAAFALFTGGGVFLHQTSAQDAS